MNIKINWTINLFDVIFIVLFIGLGYFAIQYDVASHNRAIIKCQAIYDQVFNATYLFNFTVNNTTTPIWRDPLGIDTWQPY